MPPKPKRGSEREKRQTTDDLQQSEDRSEGQKDRWIHLTDEHYMPTELATLSTESHVEFPLHDMPLHESVSKKKSIQDSGQRAEEEMLKGLKPVHFKEDLEKVDIRFQSMDIISSTFPPRKDIGEKDGKIGLIANYFEIEIPHGEVYHYVVEVSNIIKVETAEETSIAGKSSAKSAIEKCRSVNRRNNCNVIKTLLKQVDVSNQVCPAYDGVKNLYTRSPLPIVVPNTFFVNMREDGCISFYEVFIQPVNKDGQTTPIVSFEPLHQLFAGRCCTITEEILMGVMALETILRHGLTLKLVPIGRSFFQKPQENEVPPFSGGREIWMGYHQSVRIAQWKPMVNIDMSATTFYKSGPVISYMMDIFYPYLSDEDKKRELYKIRYLNDIQRRILTEELKPLKIVATPFSYSRKYRVYDISKQGADNIFFLRETGGKEQEKISVSNYFKLMYRSLEFPNLPCLNVGSAKKSVFLPLEVCNIVDGQHCKRRLTDIKTAEMIKYTARPPAERFRYIQNALQRTIEEFNPVLTEFGVCVNTNPTKLEGHVLDPPHLVYDQKKEIMPSNGAWNMKGKRFFSGETIDRWILISFSTARWCDKNALDNFADMLGRGGQQVGMKFSYPDLIQSYGPRCVPGDIIKREKQRIPDLQLAVVVLPTRGPQTIYAEIKSVAETEIGLTTQCIKDANITRRKCNPQLISNLCQKINAKMGGVNNSLAPAVKSEILKRPVIIIGADCMHPAPGEGVKPSIAAVVGSLDGYPSRYKASVRVQESDFQDDKATRQEIIVDLKEMIKDLLKAFYRNTNGKKPEKIIFYRHGLTEGEFSNVIQQEVMQVRLACVELSRGEEYHPPLTFIAVGKRNHIRFAPQNPQRDGVGKFRNVPPGTTVDTVVTHPFDSEFFMCSHTGIQGTSRPAHYTVLWDDNNMNADELQTLTYFLCHTYVRCTRSISAPCPIMYARLAASRAKQYLIYQTEVSTSSSDSSMPMSKEVLKQRLRKAIRVVEEMQNTMYFA